MENVFMNKYYHLSPEERALIMIKYNQGSSIRSIGYLLNRSPSTICREIKRNLTAQTSRYCAATAARQYKDRRKLSVKPKKLMPNTLLYNKVKEWLVYKQWPPEQISGTLKHYYPEQKDMQISHETIYGCIYTHPKGGLKKLMIHSLRQSKSKRGARGSKNSNYSTIQPEENQLIHHRPEDINERKIPGHWEGDLIAGSQNKSCVGTLVERRTGYLILSKMKSKSALDVRQGFEQRMKKIPEFLRLSMTYDRGSEMAQHATMANNLKMSIYFADPHAPWQRGSNENTNGLIRQYLPKGADLSHCTQNDLDNIAWLLNTRPRKRFGFKTPQDIMKQILIENNKSVALGF